MESYLRRKNLLPFCEEQLDTYYAAQNKKRYEASDILIQHLDDVSFDAIINATNKSDPYLIWKKINTKYASQSFNNKGKIWLNFIRHEFKGDMENYIKQCRKFINELAVVKMGIPEDVLSYTILAKLSEEHYHHVKSIMLKENLFQSPNKVLSKLTEISHIEKSRINKNNNQSTHLTALFKPTKLFSRNKPKLEHPCAPNKHNPLENHPQHKCCFLYPHLRPGYQGPKVNLTQEEEDNTTAEAHLSSTLLFNSSSEINKNKKIVLDSGATHHIINSASEIFNSTPCNIKIVTGNPNHTLNAESIGSAVLINHLCQKKVLHNVLVVPEINRCLLSLSNIMNHNSVINKIGHSGFNINIYENCVLFGSLKNNFFEVDDSHFEMNSNFFSYFLNTDPNKLNWNYRLGHPNHQYLSKIIPGIKQTENCETCQLCKFTKIPFSSNFEPANELLEVIHLDIF